MANYNPLYTKYLMDRYGVAWFKMDEISGDLLDSKGSYVGTNSGSTVVSGFDGNARSFNGTSNYISFNSAILPLGKKSIRLKIKTSTIPALPSTILGSGASVTTDHGFRLGINGDRFFVHSARGVSGSPRIDFASNKVVTDGQWHDILITWDGTTSINSVKLFIDDMKLPDSTFQALSLETVNPSSNFVIGRRPQAGDRYYNGALDEVEIYNEVIDPLASKILLSSNSEVYALKDTLLYKLSSESERNFISYGVDSIVGFNGYLDKLIEIKDTSTNVGAGRVFTSKINSANIPIKSVSVT